MRNRSKNDYNAGEDAGKRYFLHTCRISNLIFFLKSVNLRQKSQLFTFITQVPLTDAVSNIGAQLMAATENWLRRKSAAKLNRNSAAD